MKKSNNDRKIIQQLTGEGYNKWIVELREILNQEDSPLSFKNGIWSVKKRQEMWQELGPYLFDEHLDRFKEIAVEVLKETNPMFELPAEERYAASIHGKVLKHSNELRKGLAESLALLGSQPESLKNCSRGKAEAIAVISIREIFKDSDWILWGSLNSLLPTLAEAAPDEFLNVVEDALKKMPCPFDELFSQEGSGITGANYMTGLLWALETLAWDEQYLVHVTVILGKMASRDPGGNWGNRPANSLSTIFLPWFPQTMASIDKRKAAIQTLQEEFPEIAWKLLLKLLPSQHQSSMGSRKPAWRKIIPDDWDKGVTNVEYWEQTVNYSEMAVEAAKGDILKIKELVAHLRNLAEPFFNSFLGYLETEEVKKIAEEERTVLWDALTKIVIRHKKHSDAKWAFDPEIVERIERIALSLAPQNPKNLYAHLFSNSNMELYDEKGNWEEQEKKLETRRQKAIKEILEEGGIETVLHFSKNVDAPRRVGYSLGVISKNDIDGYILPGLIENENVKIKEFTSAFVYAKYKTQGWQWINQLETKKWSTKQIGMFLAYLPSAKKTWDYVCRLLGENDVEYWKRADVYPYDEENDWDYAIGKLIKYKRPNAAITCLSLILHKQKMLNTRLAIKALIDAISIEEPLHEFDSYNSMEVIKALQSDPKVNPDDLFSIEWAYLPLLTGPGKGASPKLLEQKLASDPDFFWQAISLLYRSKNETELAKETTEQQKNRAENIWRLLQDWSTIPGTQSDGEFRPDVFSEWLNSVKAKCTESGHLEVALSTIGQVLINYPPDPDGLWIHRTLAEALNAEDAEKMRHGFSIGIFNSRGVHCVDPTGKPEKELAAKYRQQAEEVENAGYYRFADTLRSLAVTYENEAKQIIEDHEEMKREEKE